MTDIPTNPLDPISSLQSGIVIKQIVAFGGSACTFIYAVCAAFGIVVTPEKQMQIGAAVAAFAFMVISAWTIYSRIKHPCPPIVPKSQLNNGVQP